MMLSEREWRRLRAMSPESDDERSLRGVIDAELSDSRAFIERLYRDYVRRQVRTRTEEIIEAAREFPWSRLASVGGQSPRRTRL